MNEVEFCLKLEIDAPVLAVWVEQGWLIPDTTGPEAQFRDADFARGRLILEMTRDMGVNEAGVDLVMELVDQLHSLRRTMQRPDGSTLPAGRRNAVQNTSLSRPQRMIKTGP